MQEDHTDRGGEADVPDRPLLFSTGDGILAVHGSQGKAGRGSAQHLLFRLQTPSAEYGTAAPGLRLEVTGKAGKIKVPPANGRLVPMAGKCVLDLASGVVVPHVLMKQGERHLLLGRIFLPSVKFEALVGIKLPEALAEQRLQAVILDGPAFMAALSGGDFVVVQKDSSAVRDGSHGSSGTWHATRMLAGPIRTTGRQAEPSNPSQPLQRGPCHLLSCLPAWLRHPQGSSSISSPAVLLGSRCKDSSAEALVCLEPVPLTEFLNQNPSTNMNGDLKTHTHPIPGTTVSVAKWAKRTPNTPVFVLQRRLGWQSRLALRLRQQGWGRWLACGPLPLMERNLTR